MHHMASQATQRYRAVLENCLKAQTPIRTADLQKTTISGFNAWEIANEVEAFTIRFLSTSLYEDRLVLCGNEPLNGLELWRSLGMKFSGDGKQAVVTTGLQTFPQFTKCDNEAILFHHCTEWESIWTSTGSTFVTMLLPYAHCSSACCRRSWRTK